REVVLEVDDHRVADLQTDLGAWDRAVISQGVRRDAIADVDVRLIGDDGRLEDVCIGVGICEHRDDIWIDARSRERRLGRINGEQSADNRKSKSGQKSGIPTLWPTETCHEDLPVRAVPGVPCGSM